MAAVAIWEGEALVLRDCNKEFEVYNAGAVPYGCPISEAYPSVRWHRIQRAMRDTYSDGLTRHFPATLGGTLTVARLERAGRPWGVVTHHRHAEASAPQLGAPRPLGRRLARAG